MVEEDISSIYHVPEINPDYERASSEWVHSFLQFCLVLRDLAISTLSSFSPK